MKTVGDRRIGDVALGAVEHVVVAVARAAVVMAPASEPAIGLGQGEGADDRRRVAMRGSQYSFCAGVPSTMMPWEPMPLLVPITERKAGEV